LNISYLVPPAVRFVSSFSDGLKLNEELPLEVRDEVYSTETNIYIGIVYV
jgi:hypothetical protein